MVAQPQPHAHHDHERLHPGPSCSSPPHRPHLCPWDATVSACLPAGPAGPIPPPRCAPVPGGRPGALPHLYPSRPLPSEPPPSCRHRHRRGPASRASRWIGGPQRSLVSRPLRAAPWIRAQRAISHREAAAAAAPPSMPPAQHAGSLPPTYQLAHTVKSAQPTARCHGGASLATAQ